MSSGKIYFFCGFMSYVLWGILPFFLKQIEVYPEYTLIFYRALFVALIMSTLLLINVKKTVKWLSVLKRATARQLITTMVLSMLGGTFLVFNWICYIYTVNNVSIHSASFSYLLSPIMTAFLAVICLGERLNKYKWAAIGLSILSCYLLGHVSFHELFYVVVIALTYSLFVITQKRNTLLARPVSLALQMFTGALVMLCFHPFSQAGVPLDAHFWIYISIVAAFFTASPLILNLYAMNGMQASQLTYLTYLNPMIGFSIGIMMFHEKIDKASFTAYSFLLVAIVIFNWDWIEKIFRRRAPALSVEAEKETT